MKNKALLMQIIIDTKKDTKEEIEIAIEMLKKLNQSKHINVNGASQSSIDNQSDSENQKNEYMNSAGFDSSFTGIFDTDATQDNKNKEMQEIHNEYPFLKKDSNEEDENPKMEIFEY